MVIVPLSRLPCLCLYFACDILSLTFSNLLEWGLEFPPVCNPVTFVFLSPPSLPPSLSYSRSLTLSLSPTPFGLSGTYSHLVSLFMSPLSLSPLFSGYSDGFWVPERAGLDSMGNENGLFLSVWEWDGQTAHIIPIDTQ